MAEQNGPAHVQPAQQIGQHLLRFAVHVIERQGQVGNRIGFAVAAPAVDQHPQSGRPGDLHREVPPHGDRAEAFVQHDDGRPVRRADPHPLIFKPASAGFHKGHCRPDSFYGANLRPALRGGKGRKVAGTGRRQPVYGYGAKLLSICHFDRAKRAEKSLGII